MHDLSAVSEHELIRRDRVGQAEAERVERDAVCADAHEVLVQDLCDRVIAADIQRYLVGSDALGVDELKPGAWEEDLPCANQVEAHSFKWEDRMRALRIITDLRVPDLETAKSFYTDYLGLSIEEFNMGWVAR